MLTPGSILKKERIRSKLSIEEVSVATKIQPHYLKAIEEDKFSKFPSSVYAKGFLQNYAKYLGVNSDRILALYRRMMGETPRQIVKEAQKPLKEPKLVITPSLLVMTTIGILVAITFAYLIYQFYNFQKAPFLNVTSPTGNITVQTSEIEVSGETEQGMLVTVNDEAVKISPSGAFGVTVKLTEGSNTLIIKARHPDNAGNEAVVTRIIVYEKETDTTNNGDTQPESQSLAETPDTATGPISVELRVVGDSAWIEVTVDDNVELADVVLPNTTRTFTAQRSVLITSGRVSITELTINGQPYNFFVDETGIGSILCEIDSQNTVICREP